MRVIIKYSFFMVTEKMFFIQDIFHKVFMYKYLQVLSHKSTTDAAASPSYSYVIKPMFGTE